MSQVVSESAQCTAETQVDVFELTDPEYHSLLSAQGRRAYVAGTVIPGLKRAENQTEIKAYQAAISACRYLDENEKAELVPQLLEQLIESNERVEKLLTERRTGARRASDSPPLPRQKGTTPN